MIITLTDKDGVEFNVEALFINEVHKKGFKTEIIMQTGEKFICNESASKVMKAILESKFGRLEL